MLYSNIFNWTLIFFQKPNLMLFRWLIHKWVLLLHLLSSMIGSCFRARHHLKFCWVLHENGGIPAGEDESWINAFELEGRQLGFPCCGDFTNRSGLGLNFVKAHTNLITSTIRCICSTFLFFPSLLLSNSTGNYTLLHLIQFLRSCKSWQTFH